MYQRKAILTQCKEILSHMVSTYKDGCAELIDTYYWTALGTMLDHLSEEALYFWQKILVRYKGLAFSV